MKRALKPYLILLTTLLAGPLIAASGVQPEQFNLSQLRALGYGEDVARYFAAGPRFLPGKQWGTVTVNGQRPQTKELEFNSDGELCFDRVMAARFGLDQQLFPQQGCASLKTVAPLSSIIQQPAQGSIQITVPQSALAPAEDHYRRGGYGLMMNYDLYHYSARGGRYPGFDSSQLTMESGANLNNWVLRSQDELSRDSRYTSKGQHHQAWLMRALPSLSAIFQAGELLTRSVRFSGLPINGVQLVSDSALTSAAAGNSSPIIGSATGNATVEVWQNGRMLYRTRVESGPFLLHNVPGISSLSDAEVVVREENGSETRFTSRVDALASDRVSVAAEYALAIGSWRKQPGMSDENQHAPLITGSWGQGLSSDSRFDSSLLLTEPVQGAALRLSHQPAPPVSLNAETQLSRSKMINDRQQTRRQQGYIASLAASYQYSPRLSLNASSNWQSAGYYDSYTALSDLPYYSHHGRTSFGYYLGIQLTDDRFGVGNLYYSASQGNSSSDVYGVGWSKKIARASVTLNWQHSRTQYPHRDGPHRVRSDRDRFMLRTSIPFGQTRALSFSASRDNHSGSQFSTGWQQRVNNDFSYSLSRSMARNRGSSRGGIQGNSDFAAYNLSFQQQDDGQSNLTVGSRGALALADGQLLSHSQPIAHTWGVLQVPELDNVRVNGAGNGRTGSDGRVLLPSLSPWMESEVRLETADIPLNVEVASVREKVAPAYGSVATLQIPTKINRSLLLTVRDAKQQYLAYGSSVVNAQGVLTGIITEQGGLLLQNVSAPQALIVTPVNGETCRLNYALPQHWDSSLEYQQADATCLR